VIDDGVQARQVERNYHHHHLRRPPTVDLNSGTDIDDGSGTAEPTKSSSPVDNVEVLMTALVRLKERNRDG